MEKLIKNLKKFSTQIYQVWLILNACVPQKICNLFLFVCVKINFPKFIFCLDTVAAGDSKVIYSSVQSKKVCTSLRSQ